MQPNRTSTPLTTLAVIGVFLFFLVNWWPHVTGQSDPAVQSQAVPLSKAEAADRAARYLKEELGLTVSVEHARVLFRTDKALAGYLQKDGLTKAYLETFGDENPLDYYTVEFAPSSGVRYRVDVHFSEGRVVGWRTDADPTGENLALNAMTAKQVLARLGEDQDQYQLDEDESDNGERFIFRHRTLRIGDAVAQIEIRIVQGKWSGYDRTFDLPTGFIRWRDDQDTTAVSMASLYLLFTFLLGLAAVIYAIVLRKRISFAKGAMLSLIYLVVTLAVYVNSYPSFKVSALEQIGGDEAALFTLFFYIGYTAFMTVGVYFSLVAGYGLWKHFKTRTGAVVPWAWPTFRDPAFGSGIKEGMKKGYLYALFLLGLQQLMFLIGEVYFDVWAVNDASLSPFNLLVPALFPLLAWSAAISEEAIFRMFGLALFKKWFKSSIVAAVLTSMIWAVGHTTYPVYPAYTRFVEVAVLGLVFCFIMLRHGFMTSVFAHAVFNTILMALSLFAFGSASLTLIAVAYMLSPAVIALGLAKLHERYGPRVSNPPTPPDAP